MIRFEKVSAFKDVDFNLPVRKTAQSAGYDFEVAQDTIVPPFEAMYNKLCDHMVSSNEENTPITLEDIALWVSKVVFHDIHPSDCMVVYWLVFRLNVRT